MNRLNFSTAPLEADSLLWGSFWQGDVISPGYTLPALELAFLRETCLAQTTTLANPQAYLAHLRQILVHPRQKRWVTPWAETTLDCVFSSGWTIWLENETVVGGYGSPPVQKPGYRLMAADNAPMPASDIPATGALRDYLAWVAAQLPAWADGWQSLPFATRTDRWVQAHRAYSLLDDTVRQSVAQWIEHHRHP